MRDFVEAQRWQDERGRPLPEPVKITALSILNDDNRSDYAAITYRDATDLVEICWLKFNPFRECSVWVTIPGWGQKIAELEEIYESNQN